MMSTYVQPPHSSISESNPALNVLLQAAHAFQQPGGDRPSTNDMVTALVQTERHCKQHRTTYPAQSLLGTWRFYFSANRKSRVTASGIEGKGFYVPRWIQASISVEAGTVEAGTVEADTANDGALHSEQTEHQPPTMIVTNRLQIGAIALQLTGPAKYLNRKNLLAFDFHHMEIRLFGQRLYAGRFPGSQSSPENFGQQSIAKLPFFAFVAITEQCIAARGRGGGLALWVSVTPKE